ncbi:MAG TPA: Cro/CI family transcriptional regulator [Rhodocyclaceae bacterium]|nr:Cro/CI family transcriptional regulator [Rhodocyclaceae bacterium]
MMNPREALQTAIRIAGGKSAAAEALGISRQAIWKWDVAPIERVADLERLAKGKITRFELRPDIFGTQPGASHESREVA